MSVRGELDPLLNAVADGLLTEVEEARLAEILRADAGARRRYRQFMGLHAGLMWDYASAAIPEHRSEHQAGHTWWRRALAIAALIPVFGALAFFWLSPGAARAVIQLESVTGAVSWSNDSGVQRTGLAAGARLAEGRLFIESETGSAQLRFDDGTLLTLTGEAELSFADSSQKRLGLRRGTLNAQVKRQPVGQPLLISTATAELEVLGTSFSLASEATQTALLVETGNVRLRRLSDGQSVEVTAQHGALASLDTKTQLRSQRPSAPAEDWARTFEIPPPQNSKGDWLPAAGALPGRFRSVPLVAGRRPDATQIIHHGITARSVPGQAAGLVTLNPNSSLHLKYRLERAASLKLFLSCRSLESAFAGNFELLLPDAPSENTDWVTLDVPLTAMEPLMADHPRADGTQVAFLMLHSIEIDAGLEVAELGIRPMP